MERIEELNQSAIKNDPYNEGTAKSNIFRKGYVMGANYADANPDGERCCKNCVHYSSFSPVGEFCNERDLAVEADMCCPLFSKERKLWEQDFLNDDER